MNRLERPSMLLVAVAAVLLVPRQQFGTEALREDAGANGDTLQISGSGQQPAGGAAPARAALCVKNSGRSCKRWREGTIVDTIMQCRHHTGFNFRSGGNVTVTAHRATCSVDPKSAGETEEGVCTCLDGYCADYDLKCYRQEYRMLPDIFTITTKVSGGQARLYMDADGTVKSGTPPDYRAAQWRISVTEKGVKLLSTEMYLQTLLQEYESCTSKVDELTGLTWSSCELVVGHVEEPRADEMGWLIEPDDLTTYRQLKDNLKNPDVDYLLDPLKVTNNYKEFYVNLRSVNTRDVFYISSLTNTARACQSTSKACPGDWGALRFDPPLIGRADLVLDGVSDGLPQGLKNFLATAGVFIFLVLVLCCIHSCAKGRRKK